MNLEHRFNFGIVGCGAIAPTHAGAIRQLGHVVHAVADPDESRARKLADQFGAKRIYRNHEEVAADADVEIACICTPSGMHADHAIASLRAGKHAIIEKPMDIGVDACNRLIAAAREANKKISIISQHRFDAASVLVKRLINSGELGDIILASADVKWWRTQQYYDEGAWRGTWQWDGGGALINQAIHTVDVLQWLAGGVKSVLAVTRTSAHERIEVEDIAVLSLQFNNGAIGSFIATTAAYDGMPARIEIHGTKGTVLLEGDALKRVSLKGGETFQTYAAAEHAIRVARGGTASVRDEATTRPTAPPGAVWGDAHRAQFEDFIQSIVQDRTPMIDGAEGLNPVKIIVAAYESARKGSAWINL